MKHRLLALLLCAAMLLGMAGCTQTPPPETTAPTAVPTSAATEPPTTAAPTEPPAAPLYSQAKLPFAEASSLSVEIVENRTTAIASEEYALTSRQQISYMDGLQIARTEELEMGIASDKFEEFYTDGMLYVTVYDEFNFCGSMEMEDYRAQLIPAVLLDETLYAQVTASQEGENTKLLFRDPTGPEAWALPEGAEFHTAEGTALLDASGALLENSYRIEYTYGGSRVTREITAIPTLEDVTLTAPVPENYTQVDSIEGLKLYDSAIMYLYASEAVTTNLTEMIVSQAAGCVYGIQEAVDYWGSSSNYASKVDTTVTFQQAATTESFKQTELFRDGTYTVTADDAEPQTNADVTASLMMDYCQEFLSENIVALDYIENITMEEIGDIWYLELDFTEEYGDFLCDYTCSLLFNDEDLLTDLATAEEVTACSGYMGLDCYTGMPVSVGMEYNVNHTIDGMPYSLLLQADQSFYLTSQTAYETITEGLLPAADADAPTPLFYHVTGEDGQEMWLLGTIHVGDERTAYLPEEIYNAFAASDALALECDTEAFEDQIEEDEDLAGEVSAAYFYSDGTTVESLMEEEEYDQAVKLLKATGNYNMNMPYAKPYLWSNSLEQFYLRQGYQLYNTMGIEERLHDWAEELDKEIREIESNMFQLKMLTGFSNDLQVEMLRDVLDGEAREYWESVTELYELWCAGDEAALREELSDEVDLSELTEEEIAEYEAEKHLLEEYNKAISYDRNDGMLETAIEYLESGDTVFYAVGLAHLLNNVNGLVDTLREAGYTVELVPYA